MSLQGSRDANFAMSRALSSVQTSSRRAGHGCFLGGGDRWISAPPEHAVLVLGPPRSGKTTSFVVPNVLAANGPVVSTSTKPDVLRATAGARAEVGRCWIYDPTGAYPDCPLPRLRWSPLSGCTSWDGALHTAATLVRVAHPTRSIVGDQSHWHERAQALLAPLLYAAALRDEDVRAVVSWVDRHDTTAAQTGLAAFPPVETALARDALIGFGQTDPREQSGIWSTAAGTLSAFRRTTTLDSTDRPDFDAAAFVRSTDTVYVAAPADDQLDAAPLVVGLVDDIRRAAYSAHRTASPPPGAAGARPPVLLALDEVANVAPLPGLPGLVSEGGSQGVVTLACLQDLSQARHRWPGQADGFLSLFGTTVVLPGIGDVATLQALSSLAGEHPVPTITESRGRGPTGRPLVDLVTGGQVQAGRSVATTWRPRLPVDALARGRTGAALAFDARQQPGWLPLVPSHDREPWRRLVGAEVPDRVARVEDLGAAVGGPEGIPGAGARPVPPAPDLHR